MKKYLVLVQGINLLDSSYAGPVRVRNLFDTILLNRNFDIFNVLLKNKYLEFGKVNEHDSFRYLEIRSISHYFKELKKLAEIYESRILFHYGPPSLENILKIIIAKHFGYQVFFDIVEDYFEIKEFKSFGGYIKNQIRMTLINKMHVFTDACSVISHKLYNNIITKARGRFSVFLLPISVRLSEFEVTKSKKNTAKIILFYGGSFGPKDGILYLLKAFDQIASEFGNVELHMSGEGAKRHMDSTYDIIKHLKNGQKVYLLGSQDRSDYINSLISSDILLMTRNNSAYANSGFPFKLGEYLAAGNATISSNVGDISKYLVDSKDIYFVKPESVSDLINAMRNLILNPKIRNSIGMNAKVSASKYFDSFSISQILESKFIEVCEK